MKTVTLIFSLLAASTAAFAQEAYRCNVNGQMIIQDRPCKIETPAPKPAFPQSTSQRAKPAPIDVGMALREANADEKAKGLATCKDRGPNRVSWKDPESVKVGTSIGGEIEEVRTQPGVKGRRYYITVNAKNSYGGYVGEKTIICYTSLDGEQLLDVDTILLK